VHSKAEKSAQSTTLCHKLKKIIEEKKTENLRSIGNSQKTMESVMKKEKESIHTIYIETTTLQDRTKVVFV